MEYDWKPPVCDMCKVFGHASDKCKLNKEKEEVNQAEKVKLNAKGIKEKNVVNDKQAGMQKDGFKMGMKGRSRQSKFVYQPKPTVSKQNSTVSKQNSEDASTSQSTPKKSWNVHDSIISEIRKSANKYSVLQDDVEEGEVSEKENWKSIVDKYVMLKQKPAQSVLSKWDKQMHQYYQEKWNGMYGKEKQKEGLNESIELDQNDVFVDKSATAKFMTENEVNSSGSNILHN